MKQIGRNEKEGGGVSMRFSQTMRDKWTWKSRPEKKTWWSRSVVQISELV